ncbi:MAG: aldehyde dehydrogenase family protein, partial [Kangiellaceae bacterium]
MHTIKNKNLIRNSTFVNGQWLAEESLYNVVNPATGEAIAGISEVSSFQVETAINSASKAFETWGMTSYSERCTVLLKWQDLIRENAKDLAILLTSEQGKPLAEAEGEILHSADYIRVYTQQTPLFTEPEFQEAPHNQLSKTTRKPVGVVTAITPWNFPCS